MEGGGDGGPDVDEEEDGGGGDHPGHPGHPGGGGGGGGGHHHLHRPAARLLRRPSLWLCQVTTLQTSISWSSSLFSYCFCFIVTSVSMDR